MFESVNVWVWGCIKGEDVEKGNLWQRVAMDTEKVMKKPEVTRSYENSLDGSANDLKIAQISGSAVVVG